MLELAPAATAFNQRKQRKKSQDLPGSSCWWLLVERKLGFLGKKEVELVPGWATGVQAFRASHIRLSADGLCSSVEEFDSFQT